MSQELYEALSGRKIHDWGQVVLFRANHESKTVTETGRTSILPFMDALNAYSEIPNPASQLIQWTTEEEHRAAEAALQANIVNRDWLDELFECI